MSPCGSFNKMFHFYPSSFSVVSPPLPRTSPSLCHSKILHLNQNETLWFFFQWLD
uniref:Uncharacterized protein n=1 Tax=Zosterops lateralis melanops TaxID=1220523 RepID=A0A8D2Q210_ZOSLA